MTLGIYSRFAQSPDGKGFDLWVQPRGTVVSWNFRWTIIADPVARLLNHKGYRGQFWVCAEGRRTIGLTRRWRYGPWTEAEARSLVDTLYDRVSEGTWERRDTALRPAGLQRRLPGSN